MRRRNKPPQSVRLTGTEWEMLVDALDAWTADENACPSEKDDRRQLLKKLAEDVSFNGQVVISE